MRESVITARIRFVIVPALVLVPLPTIIAVLKLDFLITELCLFMKVPYDSRDGLDCLLSTFMLALRALQKKPKKLGRD